MKTFESNMMPPDLHNWLRFLFEFSYKSQRNLLHYIDDFDMRFDELTSLSGKKLLLVGGGYSPIKKNLYDLGIMPARIDNVDPYCTHILACSDNLISEDFFSFKAINEYDEIWSEDYLPYGALSDSQARTAYAKAMLMLKPGGILRVGVKPELKSGLGLQEKIDTPRWDKEFFIANDIELGYEFKHSFLDTHLAKDFPNEVTSTINLHNNYMDISYFIRKYFDLKKNLTKNMIKGGSILTQNLYLRAPSENMNRWWTEYIEAIKKQEPVFSEKQISYIYAKTMICYKLNRDGFAGKYNLKDVEKLMKKNPPPMNIDMLKEDLANFRYTAGQMPSASTLHSMNKKLQM